MRWTVGNKDRNRNRQGGGTAVEDAPAQTESQAAAPAEQATEQAAAPAQAGPNFAIVYRRDHPGDRCSYGIVGNPGIIVFDKGLFKDGVAPPHITLDCEMVAPREDNKTLKAEAQVAKLAERARKAQEKIEEATRKAEEKKAKAEKMLADAKAKVDAATKATADATAAASGQ